MNTFAMTNNTVGRRMRAPITDFEMRRVRGKGSELKVRRREAHDELVMGSSLQSIELTMAVIAPTLLEMVGVLDFVDIGEDIWLLVREERLGNDL